MITRATVGWAIAASATCSGLGVAAWQAPAPAPARILRAYDAWAGHDPSAPARTATALGAYDVTCGSASGPYETLRLTTIGAAAASIVREIDSANVPAMVERAAARVQRALPGPPVTICIYAGELSGGLPFMGGVGGVALGGGRIKLFVHPTKEHFAKVPYTVAHEYHHEVLLARAGRRGPADAVMLEGKADHFAVALYPELKPPHTNALSEAELRQVWPAFGRFLKGELTHREFMIASPGPLPRWAGYRLAFEMVGFYLQNTKADTAAALDVAADRIIDMFARSPRVIAASRK